MTMTLSEYTGVALVVIIGLVLGSIIGRIVMPDNDLAELVREQDPCTVTILGTSGTPEMLAGLEARARDSLPEDLPEGDTAVIENEDGYLVVVLTRCSADPMDASGQG